MHEAPAEYFTAQLASYASLAEAQRFAGELDDGVPVGIYETFSRGQSWFAVIRGVYATHAEATTAASKLPARAHKVKPWVRNLGQLLKMGRQ